MIKMDKLDTLITDTDTKREYLARKIGVQPKQIRRWINGEAEMGIEKLKKICEYYHISANYMLDLPETYAKNSEEVRINGNFERSN